MEVYYNLTNCLNDRRTCSKHDHTPSDALRHGRLSWTPSSRSISLDMNHSDRGPVLVLCLLVVWITKRHFPRVVHLKVSQEQTSKHVIIHLPYIIICRQWWKKSFKSRNTIIFIQNVDFSQCVSICVSTNVSNTAEWCIDVKMFHITAFLFIVTSICVLPTRSCGLKLWENRFCSWIIT